MYRQCWNWPKRTGVSCRNVWNFAQGLKFKADFHSKISVCRHELGVQVSIPQPPTIPTLCIGSLDRSSLPHFRRIGPELLILTFAWHGVPRSAVDDVDCSRNYKKNQRRYYNYSRYKCTGRWPHGAFYKQVTIFFVHSILVVDQIWQDNFWNCCTVF